ncbi:alpha/beta hydrolase family protein [Streptomyces tauricus]|uniref:alpha/beta hydrolase n=1 Tax=Streptomyces tauricus TaxID=68274 RepID=UPI0022438BC7|nr:alpha/beta hydrolase [Streptomyces tauricus]MCW8096894.1 hypothetical protein [Streptomyces tauricus]
MGTVVGIHGIGQQQLGRQQLLTAWQPALGDGVERACDGRKVPNVPLNMAFYGDVFLSRPESAAASKAGAASGPWWERLDEATSAELESTAGELLPEGAIQEANARPAKARTRMPGFLRAIDRHFPAGGLLAIGDLVQVRRYLSDAEVKARVDAAVDAAVTPECAVLIGHSLGSVVAFEYVRRHPGLRLPLLVTLGSPLGLNLVRRLMPNVSYGVSFGIPPTVRAWVNVRDPRDPVASAGPLGQWWPGVDDVPPVDNGRDAHSATAYLGKKATGQAVLAALPGLSGGRA